MDQTYWRKSLHPVSMCHRRRLCHGPDLLKEESPPSVYVTQKETVSNQTYWRNPSKNDLHDLTWSCKHIMARCLGKIKSCKNLAKFHVRFWQDNVRQEIAKTSYINFAKVLARFWQDHARQSRQEIAKMCYKILAKFLARSCKAVQTRNCQDVLQDFCHVSCKILARSCKTVQTRNCQDMLQDSCKILARSCKAVQTRNCQDVLQDFCQVSCKILARSCKTVQTRNCQDMLTRFLQDFGKIMQGSQDKKLPRCVTRFLPSFLQD